MGLIYKPSDSQGLVRALNRNIRTADEMIAGLNQASKHLVTALDNKTLSGAAYTAGKGMFSQLVLPAISRASRSLDKLKSKAKQYEGFSSDAGGELLDEDKLNEQLQILQTQQATLISQINFYKQQAFSHSDNSDLKLSYIDASQQLSAYINTVSDDIQKVQDKLRKLHTFNTNVMPLFNDFKGGVNGESVKKFAVNTAVDLSAGAGATALGASVGSLILPPLGTVVGVGVGITLNVIINSKFSFLGNKAIVEQFKTGTKAITKHISDGASEITNDIGKSLSRIFW